MRIVEVTGDMVARLREFNPYHDSKGRFAPKVGHGATNTALIPSEAVDALARGESPTILPEDVEATMDLLAERSDHPDLTELRVEGTYQFGKDGLGIARKDMPQMPESRREEYMADLERRGIGIERIDLDPRLLQPMQKEIDAPAAAKIMQAMRDGTYRTSNRLTVSNDNYVLDGHHRWGAGTAFAYSHPGFTMPVERVGLGHADLLKDARGYDAAHGIESKPFGIMEAKPVRLNVITLPEVITLGVRLVEYNHVHDEKGRFASGAGPFNAQVVGAGYADWRAGLSDDEISAIRGWQHHHSTIAETLRNPELASEADIRKVSPQVSALDAAINRSALPYDMTLYRGMQGNPGHMVGRVLHDKSFISTTGNEKVADKFAAGNTLLVISAHKGQHAAYLPGIGGHQDREAEFLLPRGARIRVTGAQPNRNGMQVFDAEYVGE